MTCKVCNGEHLPTQAHRFADLPDDEFIKLMHTETLPTTLTMLSLNKRTKQAEQRAIEVKLEERRRKNREYTARRRLDPVIAAKHRTDCREYMRKRNNTQEVNYKLK